MYNWKNILTHTPTQITAVVFAGLNFAIVNGNLTLTPEAVSGANIFLVGLLGLFMASTTVSLAEHKEAVEVSKYVGAVEHQALTNYARAAMLEEAIVNNAETQVVREGKPPTT